MYKVGNKPYISLRKSFLCLMPADLDEDMVKKLLAFYDQKILSDITAHDKIEFEIVFSNYDFTTEDRLQELLEYEFTKGEIQDLSNSLFRLTDRAICNFRQNRMQDIRSLNGLKVHRENIRNNWLMAAKDVNTFHPLFYRIDREYQTVRNAEICKTGKTCIYLKGSLQVA